MNANLSDEVKRDRLYKEVRYAGMTSQTLTATSALFCLRTKGNKYMQPMEYATNLEHMLDAL